MALFSDDMRRNPFPLYEKFRREAPVFCEPASGLWLVFDYNGVKTALSDHAAFSSRHGPDWVIFNDPPRHTKLRALISQAFTPRAISDLEPRIRELSGHLLDRVVAAGEMDMAEDYAVQLPTLVIAEMLGAPVEDRPKFSYWNEVLLNMSYTIPGQKTPEAIKAAQDYMAITAEMSDYLGKLIAERKANPRDDLLTRLVAAEVDGEKLTCEEILGFFQPLLLAGSETTTNLINNAVLAFIENPDQLARLKSNPELLPSAIEEILRYRSPVQWLYRVAKQETNLNGATIPAGKLVLAVMGSANHDPAQFKDPERFDIARNPNPHIAFGHGIHFCLGAALARMEARIAFPDLIRRLPDFQRTSSEPWEPRRGLHVHGPVRLPIRFKPGVAAN